MNDGGLGQSFVRDLLFMWVFQRFVIFWRWYLARVECFNLKINFCLGVGLGRFNKRVDLDNIRAFDIWRLIIFLGYPRAINAFLRLVSSIRRLWRVEIMVQSLIHWP